MHTHGRIHAHAASSGLEGSPGSRLPGHAADRQHRASGAVSSAQGLGGHIGGAGAAVRGRAAVMAALAAAGWPRSAERLPAACPVSGSPQSTNGAATQGTWHTPPPGELPQASLAEEARPRVPPRPPGVQAQALPRLLSGASQVQPCVCTRTSWEQTPAFLGTAVAPLAGPWGGGKGCSARRRKPGRPPSSGETGRVAHVISPSTVLAEDVLSWRDVRERSLVRAAWPPSSASRVQALGTRVW